MSMIKKFTNQYFVDFEPPVDTTNYKRYLLGLHGDVFGHFDFDGSILYLHSKPAKFAVESKVDGKVIQIKLRERLDGPEVAAGEEKGEKKEDKDKQIKSRTQLLFSRTEKPEWVPDTARAECEDCFQPFGVFRRRHHCRACGNLFCKDCSNYTAVLPVQYGYGTVAQRVCSICYNALTEQSNPIEEATMKAQYYLRSSSTYEFVDMTKILSDIGSRLAPTKIHCFVKTPGAVQSEQIMTVIDAEFAPPSMTKVPFTKLLEDKLQHPYIVPYVRTDYRSDKGDVVVFREFFQKGSIKDAIYRGTFRASNPKDPYIKKYTGTGKALPIADIGKYGRHVLEAIAFLQSLGIVHYHLHSANVFIDSVGIAKLADVENSFLRLPPRALLTAKKLSPDVEAFSYFLYEMSTGVERDTSGLEGLVTNTIPANCPKEISAILKCIWDSDNTDSPMTIQEILKMPPFSTIGEKDLVPFDRKVKVSPKMSTFLEEIRNALPGYLSSLHDAKRAEKFPHLQSETKSSESSATANPERAKSLDKPPPGLSSERGGTLKKPSAKKAKLSRAATTSVLPSSSAPKVASPPTSPRGASPPQTGAAPPPPPPPSAPAPPPPPAAGLPPKTAGRASLLSSIEGFKKSGLKKATTVDKSAPLVGAASSSSSPATTSTGNSMADALAGAIMKRRNQLNMDS